jgi:hypothetical protein
MDDEAKKDGFDESNGADSNVGGSTVLVLAALAYRTKGSLCHMLRIHTKKPEG